MQVIHPGRVVILPVPGGGIWHHPQIVIIRALHYILHGLCHRILLQGGDERVPDQLLPEQDPLRVDGDGHPGIWLEPVTILGVLNKLEIKVYE